MVHLEQLRDIRKQFVQISAGKSTKPSGMKLSEVEMQKMAETLTTISKENLPIITVPLSVDFLQVKVKLVQTR